MPTYCYITEDGESVEQFFRMSEVPEEVFTADGRKAVRDFQAEQCGVSRSAGGGWPMAPCMASGVNASQAGDLREFFKKHSFGCEVTRDGDPVYTSPGHRKKALALRGLHDKDGN